MTALRTTTDIKNDLLKNFLLMLYQDLDPESSIYLSLESLKERLLPLDEALYKAYITEEAFNSEDIYIVLSNITLLLLLILQENTEPC